METSTFRSTSGRIRNEGVGPLLPDSSTTAASGTVQLAPGSRRTYLKGDGGFSRMLVPVRYLYSVIDKNAIPERLSTQYIVFPGPILWVRSELSKFLPNMIRLSAMREITPRTTASLAMAQATTCTLSITRKSARSTLLTELKSIPALRTRTETTFH